MLFVAVLVVIAIVGSWIAATEFKRFVYQNAYLVLQFTIIGMIIASILFAVGGHL